MPEHKRAGAQAKTPHSTRNSGLQFILLERPLAQQPMRNISDALETDDYFRK
jgi:hypothetical protein